MNKLMSLSGSVLFIAFLTGCGTENNTPKVDPIVAEGEQIVKANCKVCHAQGINGAPVIGNIKMWGPRITQGKDVLIDHAMNGYGLMPAKGGNSNLTRDDIEKAVTYFLSQVEGK